MESFHAASSSHAGSDADDGEMDWEEIVAPSERPPQTGAADVNGQNGRNPIWELDADEAVPEPPGPEAIEITIQRVKRVDPQRKKQAEQNAELRALRLTCHKIHTVTLLSNALTRNKWINDPLLQARLLSLAPLSLQTSFAMITKKRHPDAAKRGRLFETAVMRLADWWSATFTVTPTGHIRSRTFDQVQRILLELEFDDDEQGELVKSSKSLMKHAVNARGSRDICAQLFTALCRALGIPARLVVSLQSVPWQAGVGKPKPVGKKKKGKGKEKAADDASSEAEASREEDDDDEDDDMEEISIPSTPSTPDLKGKGRARFPGDVITLSGANTPSPNNKEKALPKPVVRLRKSKTSGQKLGSASSSRQSTPAAPLGGYPPVMWTEVFSRPDGRWMPVDPIRAIVNKRKVFAPPSHNTSNRMVYVIAVEEDGFARDVTPRYARAYGAQTTKAQLGGRGRKAWWEGLVALVTRPYRLLRDDLEDEEFESYKYIEGMPTSAAGFKDHPLYALEQHLKRDEVIHPRTEVGKFRGEPVFPRANVISLKTAENWMRAGRQVRAGAQALKWVPQRAVTIHRRRAMELAAQEGEEMLQGLYAEDQTEEYVPDPVVDGVIPKNDFGNIDLYTPSMLPAGAVHIPFKGVAKIARKLGFDFAEAVTSFEFKKGRAFPVLTGIVVAAENEDALLEAYWEAERDAAEKARQKTEERVIKRWIRLIHGLRIRARLQAQYGERDEPGKPTTAEGARAEGPEVPALDGEQGHDHEHEDAEQGGFLLNPGSGAGADPDTIVQPFHLPRFEHGAYQPPSEDVRVADGGDPADDEDASNQLDFHQIGQLRAATELVAKDPVPHAHAHGLGFASDAAEKIADHGDNDDDDEADLEGVVPTGASSAAANGNAQPGAEGGINGAPKTMQQLAEEMSARTRVQGMSAAPAASAGANAELLPKANTSQLHAASSASVSTPGKETKIIGTSGMRTSTRREAEPTRASASPRSTRKNMARGGARGAKNGASRRGPAGRGKTASRRKTSEDTEDDAEDDESELSEPPEWEANGDIDNDADNGPEPDPIDALAEPNPAPLRKSTTAGGRKRKRTSTAPAQAPVATSTLPSTGTGRVLRTRASKTAAQLQAERDAESAFRLAIAE